MISDTEGAIVTTHAAEGFEMAVTTRGLSKRFGSRTAVDGVDVDIPAGSVCGFVGPNGAGKTTTLRMLLGLIRPSGGSGTVLGCPLSDPAGYLDRVGALVEAPAFYPALSGRSNLLVLARLGGIGTGIIGPTLERVGLSDRADDACRSYSLGMKQRLGIAAALLADPSLLILDEPSNGLDPAGIVEIRRLMRALADGGVTVLVSSHLLAEIEQVCDQLVMIRDGRIVFQGPVEQLFASQSCELLARPERAEDNGALVALIRSAGHPANVVDDTVVVAAPPAWAGDLNRLAMDAHITLVHLSERPRSLEEAFFELTGTATGDAADAVAQGGRP